MIVSCHVKYSLLSMFDIILLNSSMWTVDILLTASFVEDRAGIVMHNLVFGHAISTFRPWPLLWHWMCYLFEFEFSLVWLFQLNFPKYFQQTSYIYVLPTEKSWTVRILSNLDLPIVLLKIQRISRYFHQTSQKCFWVVDLLTSVFLMNFTSYFCMNQIVWLEKKNLKQKWELHLSLKNLWSW